MRKGIHLQKEQTKKRLLQAAQTLVQSEGYENVTVRRIAEAAKCTYPLMYHYFKDRASLFWQLRLQMIDQMAAELTAAAPKTEAPIAALKDTFVQYARYFCRQPNVFRFFYFYPHIKPENDSDTPALEQRFHALWQQSFAELIRSGTVMACDMERTAQTIICAIQGLLLLYLSANGTQTEEGLYEEIRGTIDFVLKKGT